MDIASMLEVEVQEVAESKENVTPQKRQQHFPCQNFSKEENDFYKLTYGSDIASVRFLKLHCTGCDEHIGSAPSEAHNMHEHPVLRTLLCAKCREFYGDGTFEQGDDATDMFCRWCANGGNLYCCSYCSNTFCSKCIKRNFDPITIKRIEAEDSWKCFVCDPKDLFPLRSVARALITHIETVTRILENDRRMSFKDVEEKMHLDETKCCSRKRKRRRRRTISNSDDDEEEDSNYIPVLHRSETPPAKRRKIRRESSQNSYSNGYMDHEYYTNNTRKMKPEPDFDPSDLMIPEQTMIEGDAEILKPNEPQDKLISSPKQPNILKPQSSSQQLSKVAPNNSAAINPVPLSSLLKAAITGTTKKLKVSQKPIQKIGTLPMTIVPKSIATSSITLIKPPTHFLVPRSVTKTSSASTTKQMPSLPILSVQQPVIDLDSDDEPVILENNSKTNSSKTTAGGAVKDVDEIVTVEEHIVDEQMDTDSNDNRAEDEVEEVTDAGSISSPVTELITMPKSRTEEPKTVAINDRESIKTRQRNQQFKKMLILQSQEIDNTLGELKMKVQKLLQISNTKDVDLLNSAALCTKRFHRAMRKTLVELSHINDRVVKDYVHWKKKTDKINAIESIKDNTDIRNNHDAIVRNEEDGNDEMTLEMICERESEPGSDDDYDDTERILDATNTPAEFSHILDHLSIFKRKVTSTKAVGEASVLVMDKACQVYDVTWKDYEKCIGHSMLSKPENNTQEELLPAALPDENFGKYQEQYLYYLQHIEDHGIETDDCKGSPDPNHIPLKDLIDGTSPFIMDMLERLTPVNISNGCTSLPSDRANDSSGTTDTACSLSNSNENETQNAECEKIPTTIIAAADQDLEQSSKHPDGNASTSKAVEELVKMVTKLSEDLRTETVDSKNDGDKESISTVNSILDDDEICETTTVIEIVENDDECMALN